MFEIPGMGMSCISSFPYLWSEKYPKGDSQFYIALVGQIMSRIGAIVIHADVTKVRIIVTINIVNGYRSL